ncbi:restriction endonuclease subunit S [Vibrio parahaemolyticus]|uniref:restriction endonuclease subunit S n=1 Tax=Vibrio parahaemolyticus TaxID=670 RepID=UPI0009A9897E|nr:restriction endonuclease subunit S [Vibrio parahaemolyticus]
MGFEVKSIGEVCSVGDGAHSKVTRVETGIPYLTSKNIGQGFLKLDKLDYISEESFEKLFSKDSKATRRPQAGDVLFGIIGSFGNTYLYKESDFFGFSSSIGILRPNPELLDSEYLYYVVSSKKFRDNHANHNSGSVQGYTNIPTVKGLPLPVPSIAVQKKIAKVLQSLDRKIAVNQQTNQTLEAMAQAIFKSWFVDFDPVKAKMRGEQPEGMDEATASLFPEKLVESELGLIPDGWAVGTLSDVAKYCSARTSIDGVTVENYISTENMLADKKGVTAASKLPTAKTIAAYKTGDILVSNIRPYFKKIWLAEGNGGRSNDVLGFESSAPNTDSFLMNLLYQDSFFEYMTRTSKGAKMPRGDKTAIMNWEMAVPPVELREAFSTIVDKFYKLIPQNRAQNETLESLRDTLLPKLLSGEIELGQTQELIEVE